MTEQRRVYHLTALNLNELNRLLADIAWRMDELEGYRGQGTFQTMPKSNAQATSSDELVRLDQLDITHTWELDHKDW